VACDNRDMDPEDLHPPITSRASGARAKYMRFPYYLQYAYISDSEQCDNFALTIENTIK
jgi:hypothetical protein